MWATTFVLFYYFTAVKAKFLCRYHITSSEGEDKYFAPGNTWTNRFSGISFRMLVIWDRRGSMKPKERQTELKLLCECQSLSYDRLSSVPPLWLHCKEFTGAKTLIRCQELIALYACGAQLSSLLIGRHQISAETTERCLAQKQRPGEAKEKGEEIGRISGLHTTSPKPTPDVFSSQVG